MLKYTTIKDLYEWAVENNVLDLPIGYQFKDGGGGYYGDTFEDGIDNLEGDVEISASIKTYNGEDYVRLY